MEILNCLNDECGVTIFADGAQAIYGFTMEHGRSVSEESSVLLSKLMNSESEFEKYSKVSLSEVYRTKDKNLVHLFMQGRRILNEIDVNKVDSWKEFKSFIESCAHRSCKSPSEENIVNQSETLVLFRTKAEVLYESMKLWHLNVEHKIRMSGSVPVLAPWIGRIFSTYTYDNIDFNIFKNRWAELIDPKLKAVDDAWSRLLLVVGMNSGKLSLNRLREIIKRDRPPLELIIDESQFNGPVLSTVHSSKGREAKNVYFMLPPDSFIDSDNDDYKRDGYEIAEECRVLFVGATRAREKLLVGKGRQLYAQTLDNGRVFKSVMSGNKKRMVQVGIKGDLDYCSLVNSGNSLDGLKAQENLWAITGAEDVFLQYNLDKKRYELLRAEDDLIALMSTHFGYDLLAVGRQVSKKVTECSGLPQKKIKYLKVTGLTTIVIPEAQRTSLPEPWRHSGIILAPVLTGFPTIYFN